MNSTNKIFAILIVLAMSAVVGFAAITADANAANDNKIDTYQELKSAIGGSEPTVKLDGDITYGNGDDAIVISRDVTIDLNGHNISCDHGRIFHVRSANVVLDGKGTISATTSATTSSTVEYNSSVIRVGDADATKASSLTVGRDVTVSTDKMYTVTVFNDKAQGQDCELIVKGTILHYQYFKDSSGTEIWDNAAVSTNGNDTNNSSTIRIVDGGMIYSEHSVGIYLPSGKVEMTGGAVTGYTAIYSKAGQINIAGGNILATGEYHVPEHTATGEDSFKCPTGDAIVLESCGYSAGVPSLKITDGQVAYTSADEHVHQYLDFPVEGCEHARVDIDPKVSSNVAKVGNTEYPTLQRALAQANGTQKVTLLKDTVTAGFEIDDAGTYKGVNLDLGDFTVVCGVPGNNTLFKIANDNGLGVDGDVSGNNALFKIAYDNANKPNVTITAGQNGGIVADTVFYSANGSNLGDLNIDGGKYSTVHYGYPFIIYGSKNVTIKNAAIEGMVWFGNMGAEKFTADKMTVHTVRDVAIYLGVVKSATLTDVTSTSETGTALEIKSGNISVIGGKYTGYQFAPSNGQIGPSGSGDGLATVFINNQYCLAAQVDKVSVSISDADLGYSYRSSIEDYIYIVNDNQTYPISLICPDVHEVQYFANGKVNDVTVNGRNAAVVAKVSIEGGEAVEYTSIQDAFAATNGKNAVITLSIAG